MANKIHKEAELQRNVKVVVSGMRQYSGTDVKKALSILAEEAENHLKLRSAVRGEGTALASTMVLDVTIPLDTRYHNENRAEGYNTAWSTRMRDELSVISGGYVEPDASKATQRIVIETDADVEDVVNALGGVGEVVEY